MKTLKTAIGLMSGTSMDGIDAALIYSDGNSVIDVQAHMSFSYSSDFRRQLKRGLEEARSIKSRHERPGSLALLEEELTAYHGTLVKQLLHKYHKQPSDVDLIGFHGQTITHRPDENLTVQLGQGQWLAEHTGIDVIYDMRANDMAHGGQGAPFVPVYHEALARKLCQYPNTPLIFPCAFINIGGIANLTFIPTSSNDNLDQIIAFDCGPGNCLIDQWMEMKTGATYDEGGKIGLKGCVNEAMLNSYRQQPPLMCQTPGSLDWHDFSLLQDSSLSLEDGAATLATLTAQSIFNSFRFLPHKPRCLIISGGGAKNACIMATLIKLASFDHITVLSAQNLGLDVDFIEAEAWGYLAIRAFKNLPLSFPLTTGVQFPVTGGVLAAR